MPAVISESFESRPFTLGQQSGRELIYHVLDSEDEEEVQALVVATAPATYLGLLQDSIQVEPQGGGVWKAHVRYAGVDSGGGSGSEYGSEFTFDTAGGSQRITQSLMTVARYAPAGYGDPPDFGGAIGVSDDRVEGTDVQTAQFQFAETHRFLDATVDLAYKLTLRNLTYCFNDAPFRGHAAGEVLFMGASGSKRGDELWSITFRFAVSPNVTDLAVGGTPDTPYGGDVTGGLITGIDKLGWDYLWIRYASFEDDSAFMIVPRPVAAIVERVYYPADFSLLGIGVDP